MKRADLSFLLFVFVFTLSCSESDSKVTKIDRSLKDDAKELILEEVPVEGLLEYAQSCFVFDDILVVQNHLNSEKHLLEFVDLNTLEVKRRIFMRGNGPGELRNLIVRNSGSCLLIDAFMNQKFAKLNVADYLNDEEGKIDFKDYYFICQNMDVWDDSLFLVVNPYRFINKKLKIKQDVPRFLKITGDDEIDEPDLIDAINVNGGEILINSHSKRICYYSNEIPEIEIYDFDLNLLNTTKGPDKITPSYSVSRDGMVNYSMEIPVSYTYSCFNDNEIFMAYEGRILDGQEIIKTGGKIDSADTWIFRLNWEGECKEGFFIRNKKVQSLSISKDGTLYLCCEDDGVLKLYKASL